MVACLRMNGGGYAYQKAGRRPYVERHTAGQVDARDVPHQTEYRVDAQFDVDKEPWYTGTVEDVGAFWGVAGPPPLPDDVPELVKLALGNRVNRPINMEIAMSWVLATDSRLKERLRSSHKCITRDTSATRDTSRAGALAAFGYLGTQTHASNCQHTNA